jgi:hypothetical protein
MYSVPSIPTKNEVSVFSFITYQVPYITGIKANKGSEEKDSEENSVVDPDPVGRASFCRIRIGIRTLPIHIWTRGRINHLKKILKSIYF